MWNNTEFTISTVKIVNTQDGLRQKFQRIQCVAISFEIQLGIFHRLTQGLKGGAMTNKNFCLVYTKL